MSNLAFSIAQEWICECTTCGISIVGPKTINRLAQEIGRQVWCVNGHSNRFGETEVDALQKQVAAKQRALDAAEARAKLAEASARSQKGKVTDMKNRIGNGVCPCCKRSFQNLRRHMCTKHPEFKE